MMGGGRSKDDQKKCYDPNVQMCLISDLGAHLLSLPYTYSIFVLRGKLNS